MVVAVCALLVASGRADFSENEIAAEVDRLSAELRARYGFTDEQRAAGAELWAKASKRLEAASIQDERFDVWVRPFRSPGLASGRLWLTAPELIMRWAARRYRKAFNEAIAAEGAVDVEVGFMALDPREDGKP
jgi:hypothetical protein